MNRIPFLSYRRQIGAILMVIGLAAVLLLLSSSGTQTAVALPISDVTDDGQWLEGEPLIHETTNQANAHCADDQNSFYIIGGRNIDFTGNGPTHDFVQFHANTGEWVELPPVPEGLLASTAVCYEGKIYVVGGEFQGAHNDFYIYHIDENQGSQGYWSDGAPAPRFVKGAALGAWDGKLYLVGGTSQNGEQGYHPVNQVDIYDIATNTWQANAMQQAPFAFSFPGFAQEGPYLYLVGGFSGDYEHNVIVTQRLDMSTGVWTTGPLLNYGRGMVAAELTELHLYAIGGDVNGGGYQDSTDVVEVLDLTYWPFGGWRVLGTPLPEPTMGESSACTDAFIEGSIWSTGGDYFDNDGDPDIYNSNLFIPAEPCVNYYYGNLEPEQWSLSGFPGTVVRYTVPLVNDGTQVDYYSVSVRSQWPAFLPVSGVGPIEPGMAGTVQVIVVVPEGPVPIDHDTAILTVTSHGDPGASDSAMLTTNFALSTQADPIIKEDDQETIVIPDWASAASRPETWNIGLGLPFPDAFYGFAQCPDDPESFYVVAGWQGWFDNRDEVWRFDTDDPATWNSLAPYPEEMGLPSVTCYQGYLYSAGGNLEGSDTSSHFYRYEIATDTWSQLPNLLRKQNGAPLAAWDGYLYMIGGDDNPAVPISPSTQVDRYNLQTGIWEMNWGAPMPVAILGDWLQVGQFVYLVGGFTENFPINSDATLRYDLSTNTWEIGPSFTSRRTMMALDITSQYLYAIGGDANGGGSSDETNLVERLDLSAWPGGSWVNIGDLLPAPRMANLGFCSEAVTGGEIWSVGGLDANDDPTVDVVYRPSEPCADFYFGDLTPESVESTGFRGKSITFNLTIYNNGTLPDIYDISASAVWETTYPLTVGPIDPGESIELLISVDIPIEANVGDSDTALITATSQGDPAAADEATLVTTAVTDWTQGESMDVGVIGYGFAQCIEQPNMFYLFGGRPADLSFTNAVWRYDTVLDSWTELEPMSISAVGVAAACYQGDIYVAGGASLFIYNRLAIYHIATNIWTFGPPLPQPVFFASIGIWDDKLFLVGGAIDGDPWPSTDLVQIYDLVSDSWSDTPGTPMPYPAFGAGYVQTGPYLWVVGGGSGNYDYDNRDTTQRYNMATDTWDVQHDFTSQRALFALSATNSHLYAIGGDENLGWVYEPTDIVEMLDFHTWPNTSWESFDDPLPQSTAYNMAGFCTENITGGVIWSIAGGTGSEQIQSCLVTQYTTLPSPASAMVLKFLTPQMVKQRLAQSLSIC